MHGLTRRAIGAATATVALATLGVSAAAADGPSAALPPVAQADERPAVRSLTPGQRQDLQSEVEAGLANSLGGRQVSANEIAFPGTGALLTLPLPGQDTAPPSSGPAMRAVGIDAPETLADWEGCPAGQDDNRWYCFYQHEDFGGRRLQWNHAHCQDAVKFKDYDFKNRTSSWVNTTRNIAHWGMSVKVWQADGPNRLMWTERPWTKSSYVGDENNDKADQFEACRR
ncbi:peptidase inhibitor family I36 protein [Streptomyces longispororuber]|uniref:peptidase inhibitor family I36 protein n=1 Tax=Streptomyces longispororuber TaxID=68230 RepID=UPI0033FC5FFB